MAGDRPVVRGAGLAPAIGGRCAPHDRSTASDHRAGPGGTGGVAAAVAAARAGALGMLDLEGADPGVGPRGRRSRRGAGRWARRPDRGGIGLRRLARRLAARGPCGLLHRRRGAGLAAVVGRVATIGPGRAGRGDDARRRAPSPRRPAHRASSSPGTRPADGARTSRRSSSSRPSRPRGEFRPGSAAGSGRCRRPDAWRRARRVSCSMGRSCSRRSRRSTRTHARRSRGSTASETVVIRPGRRRDASASSSLRAPGERPTSRRARKDREDPGPGTRNPIGWAPGHAWPIGQDCGLRGGPGEEICTVGGIVQAVDEAIDRGIALARETRPLAPDSPLAVSHGTRYPIVQGPMTRVSDTAAVRRGGGRRRRACRSWRWRCSAGPRSARLLEDGRETARRPALGRGRPRVRPARAAARADRGGPRGAAAVRPDRRRPARPGARARKRRDSPRTCTSPRRACSRQFLKDGARRFVLEGRECGGHVGPRSSFVLWEQAVGGAPGGRSTGASPAEELHVLFAGGIHDARSAAAVAALAAPLAARGVKVGVLVGTAYLFTREAVATGAIVAAVPGRGDALRRTVLLETGPGHEVRVSPTPFAGAFDAERRRLLAEGRPAEEVRAELEALNVGRLRVAAKGVDRANGAGSPLVAVAEPEQFERGLYMLGQAATLRERITTIAELHREIADGRHGAGSTPRPARPRPSRPPAQPVRRRDHRHVGDRPGRGGRPDVLGEHAQGRRRDHRGPARPLGLAALLRPRPEGPRQDHLEVGRVRPRRPVRPAPLRHAADEPAVDRAAPPADAGSRPRGARRRRLSPTGRSPASGPPSSSAWAAARRSSRWATPSARTCRCSTP